MNDSSLLQFAGYFRRSRVRAFAHYYECRGRYQGFVSIRDWEYFMAVSRVCVDSSGPVTLAKARKGGGLAVSWLDRLIKLGLLDFEPSGKKKPKGWVSLSALGSECLALYLEDLRRLSSAG